MGRVTPFARAGGVEALPALLRSPSAKVLSLRGDDLLANHFRRKEQAEVHPGAKRRRPQNLVDQEYKMAKLDPAINADTVGTASLSAEGDGGLASDEA